MKKYKTILADPPWRYRDTLGYNTYKESYPRKGNKTIRGVEKHYSTMSDEDIVALPVADLADKQAHLYLWVTAAHKEIGYKVCRAWGFVPTLELVWIKTTKEGHPYMGMGHYYRHSHENVIFGVKGKLQCLNKTTRTVFFAPRSTTHSTKPEVAYKIIESMSPPPRIELFARQKREGWDAWGNEVESDIELL